MRALSSLPIILAGKLAFVTGANQGIGLEIVKGLCAIPGIRVVRNRLADNPDCARHYT